MSTMTFKITFSLGNILDVTKAVNKQVFPLLHQAVHAVAQQTAAEWQKEIHQAKLWKGEKDAYAATVTWRMTGDFTAIVESDYRHARAIETGRPAYDLKKMLNTSTKVRRTESGRRFLVIPMRHNISKLKAAGLYEIAKTLEQSAIVGQGKRASGEITHLSPKTGMTKAAKQTPFLSDARTKSKLMVAQSTYAWGQKLSKAEAGEHKWAQGLYRFNTSTPGGAKSSAYMTFRIMAEGSSGWIIPPQPGQHIARNVTDRMKPKAHAAFAAAIKKQLGG